MVSSLDNDVDDDVDDDDVDGVSETEHEEISIPISTSLIRACKSCNCFRFLRCSADILLFLLFGDSGDN